MGDRGLLHQNLHYNIRYDTYRHMGIILTQTLQRFLQGNNYLICRHFSQGIDRSSTSINKTSNRHNKRRRYRNRVTSFAIIYNSKYIEKSYSYPGVYKRRKAISMGGSHVNLMERKTTLRCLECKKGFCRNHCWSHHVAHGGIPVAPKYGTKKRKRVRRN